LRQALKHQFTDLEFVENLIAHVEPINKKLYAPMLNMDGSAAANSRFLDAAIPGEMFLHFPGIAAGMETLLPSLLSKGLLFE
jgi:hypothetical protein